MQNTFVSTLISSEITSSNLLFPFRRHDCCYRLCKRPFWGKQVDHFNWNTELFDEFALMNWLTCSLSALPFGSQIFAFVVTLCYGCSLMMGFRRWQLHWGKPPPTTFLVVVFFVSNLILMYNWKGKKTTVSTASKTALTVETVEKICLLHHNQKSPSQSGFQAVIFILVFSEIF